MDNSNQLIETVAWNEAMLSDLTSQVLKDNEPTLIVLNGQAKLDHPAFENTLLLQNRSRDISELLAPAAAPTPAQQKLIDLLKELFEPQFNLQQSPYQVNEYLLSIRKVPTVNFKVSNVLAFSREDYEECMDKLAAIEKEAHSSASLPSLFSALTFKPEQAQTQQKDLAGFIERFELLKNVCKSQPFSNSLSYNDNHFLAVQLKKLLEKTDAKFREEQLDELIHFISSLNSHIQFNQTDVYLRWLRQELDEAKAAREKFLDAQMRLQMQSEEIILKDEALVGAVRSEKKDNPLFLEMENLEEWIVKNRPWQKRWSLLDLERLERIVSLIDKKTQAYLRQRERLLREFSEQAFDLDAIDLLARFQNEYSGFMRYFKSGYRADRRLIDSVRAHPEEKWSLEDYEENLERLINLQRQKDWLENYYFKSQELFGPLSFNTDFAIIQKQLEFQKQYRQWLRDYHTYKILDKENRKIQRSMKKDFSSLYQDEKTQWQEVSGFLDWLVDYFSRPGHGSFDECSLILRHSQVSMDWLNRILEVMDDYEKGLESVAPYMSESAYSLFKEKAQRTSLSSLTRSFRKLRTALRHSTAWLHVLEGVSENDPIYPLLKTLSFSADAIKKIDLPEVFAKHILTNWLFEALISLVHRYLGDQSSAMKDEILKEILYLLDLEANHNGQLDGIPSGAQSDLFWVEKMPYLLHGLYPIWVIDDRSLLPKLRSSSFDALFYFNDGSFDASAFYPARMVVELNYLKPKSKAKPKPEKPKAEKPKAEKPRPKKETAKSARPEKSSGKKPSGNKIEQEMNRIVDEQYPVHADYAASLLLPLYNRRRMTPGIRKDIQKDFDANPYIIQKGDYLYPQGYTTIPVRSTKRKLNYISDDEILQALKNADATLDDQKRILEAAKQLGFQTTNTSILKKFSELLSSMGS